MSEYEISSEEGAQLYGVEVGGHVERDLSKDQERALIAAGWLTKPKEAKK